MQEAHCLTQPQLAEGSFEGMDHAEQVCQNVCRFFFAAQQLRHTFPAKERVLVDDSKEVRRMCYHLHDHRQHIALGLHLLFHGFLRRPVCQNQHDFARLCFLLSFNNLVNNADVPFSKRNGFRQERKIGFL